MATTDNIGHTPCRTTTLAFRAFGTSFHRCPNERPTAEEEPRLSGAKLTEGFPRKTRPVLRVIQSRHPFSHAFVSALYFSFSSSFSFSPSPPTFSFHPPTCVSSLDFRLDRRVSPPSSSFLHRRLSHPSVSPLMPPLSRPTHPFSEKALPTSLNEL